MKNKAIKKILKSKMNLGLIVILLIGVVTYEFVQKQVPLESSSSIELIKCVDGDTAYLNVDGVETKVRFLAIDTPETVKRGTEVEVYGKEASNTTCELLSNANEIRLEYEESNKTDKYGRLLAWIWVDGKLLQQELIDNGFAEVKYIYGDYKYLNILEEAERVAKDKRLGIWN